MPTEKTFVTIARLEFLFLLISSPFLLFPHILPWLTALTLLITLGGWALSWKVHSFPLVSTPFNSALLIFSVATLIGMLASADDDLMLSKATGVFFGLATWRLITRYADNHYRLSMAVIIFCLAGLGMIIVGIFSADWSFRVAFVRDLFNILPPQVFNLPGAADAGIQTNQLAGTILFFLFLPLAFLLEICSYKMKTPLIAITTFSGLLLAGLLLLSQSRSGWFGAIGGMFVLIGVSARRAPANSKARRLFSLLFISGSILGLYVLVEAWPMLAAAAHDEPPTTTPVGTLESVAFRIEMWTWAVEAIKDFPFTGTGLGTFRRVLLRLYQTPFTMDFAHAHNIFLQVALDVGLPGLISYLSVLGLSFYAAWCAMTSNTYVRPLMVGLTAGLAAFHIYGIADALALGSKTALAFWMALGIITAAYNLKSR